MNKNKKIIITLIGILTILIIITLSILLITNYSKDNNGIIANRNTASNKNKEKNNNEIVQTEQPDPPTYREYTFDNKLEKVSDINEYFIIKNILYSYFYNRRGLNVKESDFNTNNLVLTEEEKEEYKDEVDNKQKICVDAIYNMLADQYINEFKIDKNNIKEKFGLDNYYKTIIQKIYLVNNKQNICSYVVSGINIDLDNSQNIEFTIIITTDSVNNTFVLWPEDYVKSHNYNNLNLGDKLEVNIDSIADKNYNTFEYNVIEGSEIAEEYFNNYRYSIMYNTKEAYKKLDNNYAKERFGSEAAFEKYISENRESFSTSYVSKYAVVDKSIFTDYRCIDNEENSYIFRVYNNDITDYKVFLDDYEYTMMTESIKVN